MSRTLAATGVPGLVVGAATALVAIVVTAAVAASGSAPNAPGGAPEVGRPATPAVTGLPVHAEESAAVAERVSSAHGPQGAASAPVVSGHRLTRRWLMIQNNFQASGNVERVVGLLDRAAAAGYNGALLADVKFGRLEDRSLIEAYHENLRSVLAHARSLGMQVVPGTADFGYSESILWHDPNLAEGLPVRDATFRVSGGALEPFEEPAARIANGDFERLPASGDAFPDWAWQDAPGSATFVDASVRHGGQASLRMTDVGLADPEHGHGRIMQRIAVRPFRYYHASVWLRTREWEGGDVRLLVLGQAPGRTLQWNDVPVAADQDWARFDVTFNTLTHTEILLYLGVWGGRTGSLWWDDAAIEPAGFVNLIRRPGAPLRLRRVGDASEVREGRDVAEVVDPRMGRHPWPGSYDLWHEPPRVVVPAGSGLREGDVVLADYYHMTTIYSDQVTASLTEPAVLSVVEGQLDSLRREFGSAEAFSGWLLGYDEIRVHGWDEAPVEGDTPGQHLAAQLSALHASIRQRAPEADLFIWSDLFDPYHNAAARTEPYYLVNGDWSGSWEGLASDFIVVNWNHQADRRRESAGFFAARGHRQMLAGYYDSSEEDFADRQWLEELAGVPGIEGVMFTQWGTGYDRLEAWARHVWGGAPWTVPGSAYLPACGR